MPDFRVRDNQSSCCHLIRIRKYLPVLPVLSPDSVLIIVSLVSTDSFPHSKVHNIDFYKAWLYLVCYSILQLD